GIRDFHVTGVRRVLFRSLYVDGFEAGFLAQNPDGRVNKNYIGSFSDVALAAEAANTHIQGGADILTGSAQMVVGAVGVAEENGVLWFASQADQTELAPSVVVANQVYHWEVVLRDILERIEQGQLGGQAYAITLANGGQTIDFNPNFDIPEEVRARAEEVIEGIKDGSITIPLPDAE